jgi:hypothetical protein
MSRAFVNEDATHEPEPTFPLPDRESEHYPAAAARALIEGANAGHTLAAENATGFSWGAPELVEHVEAILAEALKLDDARMARLARRYLKAARRG